MADSPFIVDVTRENFESVILHGSMQGPVLVDFWADWCEPCKSLMPILAKLAEEYQGGFTLAKVDTEAEQEIAGQLGIRSLPTVKLIINGAVADEFTGALPESDVRAFLEKHIGAPAVPEGGLLETAQALAEQGQTEQALQMLREAQAAEPENGDIAIALGQMCMATGNYDDARQCLSILSEADAKKPEAVKLKGVLALSDADDSSRDEQSLMADLEKDKGNSEAAYLLGVKQALRGDTDSAVTTLLNLMMRDREYGDDAARKTAISLFESMGEDPQVSRYRRKMASMLN